MNFPLNISTKRIFKGELNEETSILKADPTFEFDIFTADSWNKVYSEKKWLSTWLLIATFLYSTVFLLLIVSWLQSFIN